MNETYRVLQPAYVKNFQCDINKCEENCCTGWRIDVDSKTFDKFLAYPRRPIRRKLLDSLKKTKDKSSQQILSIKMTPQKRCPHFMSDGLCYIHKHLGENYLPAICKTFPRNYVLFDSLLLKTLDISCPIAAQLLLCDENAMDLEISSETLPDILFQVNTPTALITLLAPHFVDMINFIFSIRKNVHLPSLEEKFFIIGLFLQHIDKYKSQDKLDQIPSLVRFYEESIPALRAKFAAISCKPKENLQIALQVIDKFFSGNTSSPQANQLQKQVAKALGLNEQIDLNSLLIHYKKTYEMYYFPTHLKTPYISSNYFYNHFLLDLFPFTPTQSLHENYFSIIAKYSAIELLLVGLAAYHKEKFSKQHIIKLLQLLDKLRFFGDNLPQEIQPKDILQTIPLFKKINCIIEK